MREDFAWFLNRHARRSTCERYENAWGYGPCQRRVFDLTLTVRLVAAAAVFAVGVFISDTMSPLSSVLFAVCALCAGYDVLLGAVQKLLCRQYFDENTLVTIAAFVPFCLGKEEDGAAVVLLFQIGSFFLEYAADRIHRRVVDLPGLIARSAVVLRNGTAVEEPADCVAAGDTVLVKAGALFAVDCVVLEGRSSVRDSTLTGVSVPRDVGEGTAIASGTVNISSPLKCRATATAAESFAARMLADIHTDQSRISDVEALIHRCGRYYAPVLLGMAVVFVAALSALTDISFADALSRGLVFPVMACQSVFVLTASFGYYAGVGRALKLGVFFKSTGVMDDVARAGTAVLDKDAMLTTGDLRVAAVMSERIDADTMLKTAAHAELLSSSPVGKAIVAAYSGPVFSQLIKDFKEDADKGVSVVIGDIQVCIGTAAFVRLYGAEVPQEHSADMAVYMSLDGAYAGRFMFGDTIRDDAEDTVLKLGSVGVHVAMLTGDNRERGDRLARTLGIHEYYSGCGPEEKAAHIAAMKSRMGSQGRLIFAGDGTADAPAMAAADAGIAVGGIYGNAAEPADVVLLNGGAAAIPGAILSARSTSRAVRLSLLFIIAVKLAVIILGVLGFVHVWLAVIADAAVALLAVLNSAGALRARTPKY